MKQLIIAIILLCTYNSIAQPAWQQRVDTKIEVTLDDKHHILRANEEITYINNSPDTLRFIYLHLWPNAYKNDHTPFERQQTVNGSKSFYYSKPADKGFIDSLQFSVDGIAVDHYSADNAPDITRIDLVTPLLPGQRIKLTTPFKVKIPLVFSRMGHTGQAYYISQWFPKPAVYDPKGWHPISYLDQGEFYSEYGSYDVSITLPSNYVVMATGNCTDDKENAWMDELAKKPLPDIRKKAQRHNDTFPSSSLEMKTIHYHEDNVHDFAWFADKRLWVKKDTVYTPGTHQLVTAWAAFMPSYWQDWQKATDYLKETIRHYGSYVGPYQYKTIKAVAGDLRAGGGMEYPTVTVIEKSQSSQLRTVIVHEAGHNWFYGMLGSNERDHAWMDEGMNTFYEQKTSRDLDHDTSTIRKPKLDEALVYFERARNHTDQAIEQTSANFEKLNYGLDIYYKTAMSMQWLEAYMGKDDFAAGMHEYYDTWHFHHPYPEDFKAIMQRHTAKSIDWFFETMLGTDKEVDFKITNARVNGDHTDVTVKNMTGAYSPVLINAYQHDRLVGAAASAPFTGRTTLSLAGTDWNTLRISSAIPDAKPTNDIYRRNGLFHHFGLHIKPFLGLNLYSKEQMYISPAAGYNQYDGWMAGILLHNLSLPENRFRFIVTPLYSFQTKTLTGAASAAYVWYPKRLFREVTLQADAKTFHYNEKYQPWDSSHAFARYTKFAPSLTFVFDQHNAISPVTNTLSLKGYSIDEEYFDTVSQTSGVVYPPLPANVIKRSIHHNYGTLTFTHANSRAYNAYWYILGGQVGADFAKLNISGNIRIDYNKPGNFLLVRAYFGKLFTITNTSDVIQRYSLNATNSGTTDYLYEGAYIGRSAMDKMSAQQISITEGGFKVPVHTGAGRSDNWIGTINLTSTIPSRRLPVYLFFDAGLIPNANPTFKKPGSTTVLYEGGVQLELSIFGLGTTIYVPLIMSSDFQNYLNDSYGHKNAFLHGISFRFKLYNNWLLTPQALLASAGG